MEMKLSEFGRKLACGSGIGELMDDLGAAIADQGDGKEVCFLGGGQPSHIPELDAIWQQRLQEICDDQGGWQHMLGNYEPPAGNHDFRSSIASLFQREFGWDLTAKNVGVTMGAQTAFFFLLNSLAGRDADGNARKILLPIIPEYIGYANQSVGEEFFVACRPQIEKSGDHEFKYRVDFDNLRINDDIAAICVSRPTNPTGNVLTDDEIHRLSTIARQHDIPLIIDNAYGAPFPGVIFTDATPVWDDGIILTLSLSKIGLPGTRTGIVVANEEVIRAISSMTSIVGLANCNAGQAIAKPLIESGEILRLSREVARPYYEEKSIRTQQIAREVFDDRLPYRIHRSEGAFFLWLWFEGLPITSKELYRRLKERSVFVIPGNYFFFGDDGSSDDGSSESDSQWQHRDECIRVSFTMPEATVRRGFEVIAEEVAKAYDG